MKSALLPLLLAPLLTQIQACTECTEEQGTQHFVRSSSPTTGPLPTGELTWDGKHYASCQAFCEASGYLETVTSCSADVVAATLFNLGNGSVLDVSCTGTIASCSSAQGTTTATATAGRSTAGLADVPPLDGTLGSYWAKMLHGEASAVIAFRRLAREIAAHGAPADLVTACNHAAIEERRHAALMVPMVAPRKTGHSPVAPRKTGHSPVKALRHLFGRPSSDLRKVRPLVDVLVENLREGVFGEAIGAAVLAYQAKFATDRHVARITAQIAQEEASHAALSFRLVASALRGSWRLPPAEREAIAVAVLTEIRALVGRGTRVTERVTATLAEEIGWPDDTFLSAIEEAVHRSVLMPLAALARTVLDHKKARPAAISTGMPAIVAIATIFVASLLVTPAQAQTNPEPAWPLPAQPEAPASAPSPASGVGGVSAVRPADIAPVPEKKGAEFVAPLAMVRPDAKFIDPTKPPVAPPAEDGFVGVEAGTGINAPQGTALVGLGVRRFGITVHGGVGLRWDGRQWFAGAYVQPLPKLGLGVGGTWSMGELNASTGNGYRHWRTAHFLSGELFKSFRTDSGVEFHLGLGAGITLNPGDAICGATAVAFAPCESKTASRIYTSFRVAFFPNFSKPKAAEEKGANSD